MYRRRLRKVLRRVSGGKVFRFECPGVVWGWGCFGDRGVVYEQARLVLLLRDAEAICLKLCVVLEEEDGNRTLDGMTAGREGPVTLVFWAITSPLTLYLFRPLSLLSDQSLRLLLICLRKISNDVT